MKEPDIEGLLIYELGDRQWDIPELRELLEVLIPKHNQYQGMEITHTFPTIGEKIMIINACRVIQKIHRQQIILLAIEDITELRKKGHRTSLN